MIKLPSRVASAWNHFWFEPQGTASLALFRVAFGLVAMIWTIGLAPDMHVFFGPHGVMPSPPDGDWGFIWFFRTDGAVVATFCVTLLSAIALTLGWHSRIAAALLAVAIHSFLVRNPGIWNSGDQLLGTLAIFVALAPSGAALSLDRLRTDRARFWEFPERSPWALRLIQIQVCFGYLSSVWHKIGTSEWRDGTAVSYALRIEDMTRFPTPAWLAESPTLSQIMSWTTLEIELALGILVWVRIARPYVLATGVMLHLGMGYALMIGLFSIIMVSTYLAFIPSATSSSFVLALRNKVLRASNAVQNRTRRRKPTAADAVTEGGNTNESSEKPQSVGME